MSSSSCPRRFRSPLRSSPSGATRALSNGSARTRPSTPNSGGDSRAPIAAAARELDDWLGDSTGALALMVLLDQFPRNAYRGTAHMFATDPLARYCAEYAIGVGHDLAVDAQLRQFFYLPFEHAEDLEAQERGVALMEALAATRCAGRSCIATSSSVSVVSTAMRRWALTTPAEQAFLDGGGFRADESRVVYSGFFMCQRTPI